MMTVIPKFTKINSLEEEKKTRNGIKDVRIEKNCFTCFNYDFFLLSNPLKPLNLLKTQLYKLIYKHGIFYKVYVCVILFKRAIYARFLKTLQLEIYSYLYISLGLFTVKDAVVEPGATASAGWCTTI